MPTPYRTLTLALVLVLVLALVACETAVGTPPPQPEPEPAVLQVTPSVVHPGELVSVTGSDLGTVLEVRLAGIALDPSEIHTLPDGVRFAMPDPPRNGALELTTADGVVHPAGELHAFGLLHVEAPWTEAFPYEQPLREPFVVLLLNSDQQPIPNALVRFTIDGARFDALDERTRDHATTDARGRALTFASVAAPTDWPCPLNCVAARC